MQHKALKDLTDEEWEQVFQTMVGVRNGTIPANHMQVRKQESAAMSTKAEDKEVLVTMFSEHHAEGHTIQTLPLVGDLIDVAPTTHNPDGKKLRVISAMFSQAVVRGVLEDVKEE